MAKIKYKDSEGNIQTLKNVKINYAKPEEEWQPEPDWWDIDKILGEDTEDYPAKVIALFYDWSDENTIYDERASKIKTSDGAEYTKFNVKHTWDKSKDKECSKGYKTRYLIYYYSDSTTGVMAAFPAGTFYVIFEGFNSQIETAGYGITRFDNKSLIAIKYKKSKFKNPLNVKNILFEGISEEEFYNNVTSLAYYSRCGSFYNGVLEKNLNKIDFSKLTNLTYAFSGRNIPFLDIKNTQNVTYWRDAFSYSNIPFINSLDFSNCKSEQGTIFYETSNTRIINEVKNIKYSGMNFSTCSKFTHDTLIRILNALYDYSGSENTYTITLGATNLAKLTEEEIAIGTNKGWAIS